MDDLTLHAYDHAATAFADDWDSQPAGTDLQECVLRYFRRPGLVADIGCGSGRDAAWLAANGFDVVGFEPSEQLLAEARRRHPEVDFRSAALPELADIPAESFDNVLCETVIMHLDPRSAVQAAARLIDIVKPGGTLYLTWRVTEGEDQRDDSGRLYAVVDAAGVRNALVPAELLLDEEVTSGSSGKTIRRVIARKPPQR
ncbi:class I SAM-dependent methyltransferase [Kribbella qitaiheensis]|uniref:class I SAM-dependent methyltransferase n=1 Tax=Kribbella qitaiheensis TaxID=1544730 RepID=UPI00361C312B